MSTPTTTKTIEITVSPEGATTIRTSGFTGTSCKDASRELERALGVAGTERLLPEFYGQASNTQQLRQGQ
jgi:hypothetical protein